LYVIWSPTKIGLVSEDLVDRKLTPISEKELITDELERELSFREFVIYPSRDHIVIMKRNRRTQQANSQRKSISIVISVDKCQFLVLQGQVIDNAQKDFNQIFSEYVEGWQIFRVEVREDMEERGRSN